MILTERRYLEIELRIVNSQLSLMKNTDNIFMKNLLLVRQSELQQLLSERKEVEPLTKDDVFQLYSDMKNRHINNKDILDLFNEFLEKHNR